LHAKNQYADFFLLTEKGLFSQTCLSATSSLQALLKVLALASDDRILTKLQD